MKRGFTIHHNGPEVAGLVQFMTDHTRCLNFWRGIRNYHVNDRGWSDIAYSFGVCPHGEAIPGRGWNRNQWANGEDQVGADDGPDSEWYSVMAFIGGTQVPNHPMIGGITHLIHTGRKTGLCGYRIFPHNFWKRKACPGTELTVFAASYDNRPLPIMGATNPQKEDPDMYIADCKGKPALVVNGPSVKTVNTEQRNALRFLGVPAILVSPDQSDALRSIGE